MPHLNVRNEAQRVLFEKELSGQISDGMWENARPNDHWKAWCDAKVRVATETTELGRNFYAQRDNYNFASRDLISIVGDRMIEYVRTETGNTEYGVDELKADLADLKTIVRIQRPSTESEQLEEKEARLEQQRQREAAEAYRKSLAVRLDELIGGYTRRYGSAASISWSRLEQLLELAEKARDGGEEDYATES